jgi:hypothetical protein
MIVVAFMRKVTIAFAIGVAVGAGIGILIYRSWSPSDSAS